MVADGRTPRLGQWSTIANRYCPDFNSDFQGMPRDPSVEHVLVDTDESRRMADATYFWPYPRRLALPWGRRLALFKLY